MAEYKAQYDTEFFVDLAEQTLAKVLHVDDETSLLKVAKQCLEIEGPFQVDTAVSVEEAEKKMKKKIYDIIVSDYMMPGKTGLDFLRQLREDGNTVPFIMFTGRGREEVAVQALNLGADQYVNKSGHPETVYGELSHSITRAMERKRAEGRVRISEEKFRNIFESASDAMIYLDRTGRVLDVNQKTVEIYGGEKGDLLGKQFTKLGLISPKEIPILMKAFARGLAGKHPTINTHIRNRKGQMISLECQASIMKTSGETSLLVIARDMTKRRQAEEMLKKSEEKYKALLEETPIGLCNLDLKGKITYANKAFEKITGYSNDETLGKSAFNLARQTLNLSKQELEPITKRIRNRLTGKSKSIPMTIRLRRKDGTLRWVEAESKLNKKFGIPTGLQAIIRDVTERKQAEEKIRQNEERFRSIVENSHGGIGIVDDSFRIKYVNEQAMRILGYSRDEMIGQDFRKFLHGESGSLIQNRYLRRQRGEEIPSQYEFEMLRKDGKKIIIEMKVVNLQNGQGRTQTIAEFLDITDRKKAYKTLQESEAKFRNLAEQLPNMVFINKGGRVVYANKKCMEIMGYTEEEFYSPSFDFLTLVAPESVDVVTSAFRKHINGKEIHPYEYALITKNGKRIEAIITTKLIKYDGENAILGIITDITERTKEEKKLRSSEELLDHLFQRAPDAYFLIDLKGTLVGGNKAAEELTGFDKDELIGKNFLKMNMLSRREISQATNLFARNTMGRPTGPDEFTLIHKNGQQASVEIRTFPINIRERALVLVIAHDVTERKNAEREIFESQEKFRRLFMENPEAAIYVDSNFHILEANPRFTELFGYQSNEIVNRCVNDLVVPQDSMQEAKMLDKKSKQGYIYHNTVRKRKDGTLVPVAISAAPLIVGKKVIGHIALYKDISKLKQTERALRDTLEKLRVVGGLTRHDVQNKLSLIAGNIYLAKNELSQEVGVRECLEDSEIAIKQAEEIFDFARDYEKLGAEQLTCIDLGKSIEEALSLIKDLHNVKILNDCRGLTVMADSLLRQLFYNLIDNSLKHGEKVSQIRVYSEKMENGRLKLVYEDDGIGISAKEKKQIFREGYGKGTGYGLYLIKRMCEVYGWTIEETGDPSIGAKFIMTIPFKGCKCQKN